MEDSLYDCATALPECLKSPLERATCVYAAVIVERQSCQVQRTFPTKPINDGAILAVPTACSLPAENPFAQCGIKIVVAKAPQIISFRATRIPI